MTKLKRLLFIAILFSIILNTYGGVNLKNGNFYVSYTDVLIKDSVWEDLEITRTYNSKSVYYGSLAFGWGYLFETYLDITPEYSVAIKNHGAGGTVFFESEQTTEESIQQNIALIIEAGKKGNSITTPEDEVKITNKLTSSMAQRLSYYTRYRNRGLIDSIEHQSGVMYYSQGCGCIGEVKPGYSYIISTDDGYSYFDFQTNKIWTFNKIGKMIGLASMKNPELNLSVFYDLNNKIKRVETYNGSWLDFKLDSSNRIVEISSSNSSNPAKYWYKGTRLELSKDINGNYHKYEYDRSYNMTKIVYNPIRVKGFPEDAKQMIYEPRTYFISKIIERDSSFTSYTYLNANSNNEYGTQEQEFDKDSTLLKDLTEWWFIKANDHGKRWTYKKINVINGDSTTREFHEISRKPLIVKNSEGTFNFSYDPTGLLLSAETPAGINFIVNYNDNNDMSSVQYLDTLFELRKVDKGYSSIILPNEKAIELPITDYDNPDLGEYKEQLLEIKKLFDLSYYEVL